MKNCTMATMRNLTVAASTISLVRAMIAMVAIFVFTPHSFAQLPKDIDFDKLKGLDYRSEAEKRADRAFMKKFSDVPVVDTLIPGSPQSYVDPTIKGFEDMAKMSSDWGFSYVSYSAAVDEWVNPAVVIDKISNGRNHWLANPETYILVETVDDMPTTVKNNAQLFRFLISINQ